MNCILSIIIPTKNRYSTLLPLLDALCRFNSNNFEVVIQDNSENNEEILNYLECNKDLRLKYFYCSDKLSVIDNSDLAVNHTTGDYICFIGDDDGVMPYIVEVVEWMELNQIKALKSFKPNYYWPDQKSNYLSNDISGALIYEKFDYSIKKVDAKGALDFTLKKGGTSMKMLPCLYHGVIKKEVLNQIFKKCNTFFPGPSPDMANGIALTKFIEEYTYVDFPVVISGKSAKSTGGQGVLHKHISRIEDVGHLPEDTAKYWSKEIPKFWTGQTIWAESVLKSLENCGDTENKKNFRYSYLYASIMLFNFGLRKKIFEGFTANIYTLVFFKDFGDLFFKRSKIFVKNRLKKNTDFHKTNIKTIGECISVLVDKVNVNNLPFKEKENN
jgi:glycosyltransferase involved in cell wall biosynthesis